MSAPQDASSVPSRRRGSEDSRSRLLEAARTLFTEHGYEQTTVRTIGVLADVDPALIARYFGSKAALYVEAIRPQAPTTPEPLNLTDPVAVREFLDRIAPRGPTPALHAAIRPHTDPELQAAAIKILTERLLDPTEHRATQSGLDKPRLRSEVVVAALAGIVISRSSGAFPELSTAPSSDVAALLADLIEGLIS